MRYLLSVLALVAVGMFGCVDDDSGSETPFFLPPSDNQGSGGDNPLAGGNQGGEAGQGSNGSGSGTDTNNGSTGSNGMGSGSGSTGNGGGASSTPGTGSTTPDAGMLGAPCTTDADCQGGLCLTSMPNGYCTNVCESSSDCDAGLCFGLQSLDDQVCLLACDANGDCRVSDGYECDSDNTCFPGSGGGTGNTGSAGSGSSPIGGACNEANDCADAGARCIPPGNQPGDFIDGYCYLPGCSESSPCPAGSTCFTLEDDTTACFPDCSDRSDCRSGYACIEAGTCMPGCTEDSCPNGLVCNDEGLCDEPPCTSDSCGAGLVCGDNGRCVLDLGDVPSGPVPNCDSVATWECTGSNCGDLIQVDPRVGLGYNDYGLNSETLDNQYRSWARRDLLDLVTHAADMVACLSENWTVGLPGPLGLGDMSEENGAIPGTSDGQPGHPPSTHTNGFDMDIAYYMLQQPQTCRRMPGCDDCHCLSPVCEYRVNGRDQYHCVEDPSILDVWRTALFLAYLHQSPQLRVIGVDGKIGPLVTSAIEQLCDGGWIPDRICRGRIQLAYETTDMGQGWYYFHHHHLHVSITGPGRRQSVPVERLCLTDPCMPMSLPHHDPRAHWVTQDVPVPIQSLPSSHGHAH